MEFDCDPYRPTQARQSTNSSCALDVRIKIFVWTNVPGAYLVKPQAEDLSWVRQIVLDDDGRLACRNVRTRGAVEVRQKLQGRRYAVLAGAPSLGLSPLTFLRGFHPSHTSREPIPPTTIAVAPQTG